MVLNIKPAGYHRIDIDLITHPKTLHGVKTYGIMVGWFAKFFGFAKDIHDRDGNRYIVDIHSLGKIWNVVIHNNKTPVLSKNESLSERVNQYFLEKRLGSVLIDSAYQLEENVKEFWKTGLQNLYYSKKDFEVCLFLDKALTVINLKLADVEKSYENLKVIFLTFAPNNQQFNSIFLNDHPFQEKIRILKEFKKQLTQEKLNHPFPKEVDL